MAAPSASQYNLTFTHSCTHSQTDGGHNHCVRTASSSGVCRVRCLAQGHLDTRGSNSQGDGDWTGYKSIRSTSWATCLKRLASIGRDPPDVVALSLLSRFRIWHFFKNDLTITHTTLLFKHRPRSWIEYPSRMEGFKARKTPSVCEPNQRSPSTLGFAWNFILMR